MTTDGRTSSMVEVKRFTIGEIGQRTGVATSALRFYEEHGLIHSERNRAGHRRYHADVMRRVSFIRTAQRVGLSLDEIGDALASLPESAHADRRRLGSVGAFVAAPARRTDRTPDPAARPTRRMYRMWLLVARLVWALEPRRRCRRAGYRPALPAQRRSARSTGKHTLTRTCDFTATCCDGLIGKIPRR